MRLAVDAITHLNAARVAASAQAAIRGGDRRIDFSGVVRCDTSAVACVLAWLRTARAAGQALELVAVPADLLSLARLYGVEALIAPSLAAPIASPPAGSASSAPATPLDSPGPRAGARLA
jgi:phospholipid transport system transporter-binding protein